MRNLPKYTFGIGDRFTREGEAQLRAFQTLAQQGVHVAPVWNKSEREHTTIGTKVETTRQEADAAVKALGWKGDYFVDADHIKLSTVERYLPTCNFFTLDVADELSESIKSDEAMKYINDLPLKEGTISLRGCAPFKVSKDMLVDMAQRFVPAIRQAKKIYEVIRAHKGSEYFATEVSMDEVDRPQSSEELLFILAALAKEGVPVETIAPRFPGRFNKGVEYVGEVKEFEVSFGKMLASIEYAVEHFKLPASLKLSVHSGSDKFAIYPVIAKTIAERGAGIHIKTAGTTWLEECIGIAEAGEAGWIANMYKNALYKWDVLCKPYASVIDINRARLSTILICVNCFMWATN